jgi:hypothetical protein
MFKGVGGQSIGIMLGPSATGFAVSGNHFAEVARPYSIKADGSDPHRAEQKWDPPVILPRDLVSIDLEVPIASFGDFVVASFSEPTPAGVTISASVSAPGIVRVVLINSTGEPVRLGPGNVLVRVLKD